MAKSTEAPGLRQLQDPLRDSYQKHDSLLEDGIGMRFGRIMIGTAPVNSSISVVNELVINCRVLVNAKHCRPGCTPEDMLCEQPSHNLDALRHYDRHRGLIKAYRVEDEWVFLLMVRPFRIPPQLLRRTDILSRGERCEMGTLKNIEINIGIEYRASEDISHAMVAICPRLQAAYNERSRIRFVGTFRNPSVPSQKRLELHYFDERKSSMNLVIEVELEDRRAVIEAQIFGDRQIRQQLSSVKPTLVHIHPSSHPNNDCQAVLVEDEKNIVEAGLHRNDLLLEDKVDSGLSSIDGLLQQIRNGHDDLLAVQAEERPCCRRKWRVPRVPPGVYFYRTVSKRIIHENEELSESDEDRDEKSLLLEHSSLTYDELARITEHEQEFVRRLNEFLWKERIVTDSGLFPALADFVKANTQWILGASIREEMLSRVYDRFRAWKSLNNGQILELQQMLLVHPSSVSHGIEHDVARSHHPERQEDSNTVDHTAEWPQVEW